MKLNDEVTAIEISLSPEEITDILSTHLDWDRKKEKWEFAGVSTFADYGIVIFRMKKMGVDVHTESDA